MRLFLRLRPRTANWIEGNGRNGDAECHLRHRCCNLRSLPVSRPAANGANITPRQQNQGAPVCGCDSWDLVQLRILPRREVLRLFLRLRPRAAGILDLVEAVASTRPLLTSSSENTFPLLASDRATRMIFAKSGLRLRATDSLSKPLKDIRAATGFSFEVMTMDSESSSAV